MGTSRKDSQDNLLAPANQVQNELRERLKSDFEEALLDLMSEAIVAEDVNVLNTLLLEPNINLNLPIRKKDDPSDFKTLLCIAAAKLGYNIIKILLSKGANPNIKDSDNITPFEMLFIYVQMIELGYFEKDPFKRNLTLFGIKLPIKVDMRISKSVISIFENCIDLLLCYGLDINFRWSTHMLSGSKDVISAVNHENVNERALKAIYRDENAELNAPGVDFGVKYLGKWRLQSKDFELKKLQMNRHQFSNYFETVKQLNVSLVSALKEIEREKKVISDKNSHLNPLEVSAIVAETRMREKRNRVYWKNAADPVAEIKGVFGDIEVKTTLPQAHEKDISGIESSNVKNNLQISSEVSLTLPHIIHKEAKSNALQAKESFIIDFSVFKQDELNAVNHQLLEEKEMLNFLRQCAIEKEQKDATVLRSAKDLSAAEQDKLCIKLKSNLMHINNELNVKSISQNEIMINNIPYDQVKSTLDQLVGTRAHNLHV